MSGEEGGGGEVNREGGGMKGKKEEARSMIRGGRRRCGVRKSDGL